MGRNVQKLSFGLALSSYIYTAWKLMLPSLTPLQRMSCEKQIYVMSVVKSLEAVDVVAAKFEKVDYEYLGEFGIFRYTIPSLSFTVFFYPLHGKVHKFSLSH